MGKRSPGLERRERDFYATPAAPIYKLLPHIKQHAVFAEPMCGDGAIIKVLESRGWRCGFAADIEPQGDMDGTARVMDAFSVTRRQLHGCNVIVTNPPWPASNVTRPKGEAPGWPTVDLIEHFRPLLPTWFLLSADFAHNEYAVDILPFCEKIVSVGRVRWIEGSAYDGKDNAAWYKFVKDRVPATEFHGRASEVNWFPQHIEEIL